MTTTSPRKILIRDLLLFLLVSIVFWQINIIGQSTFPGARPFPILVRSSLFIGLLTLSYVLNYGLSRRNGLGTTIFTFKWRLTPRYLSGSLVALVLIATIWIILYLVNPFRIIRNVSSHISLTTEFARYVLGNTLEELLFRGFLLLACTKLCGKTAGIVLVSLLFGLFHLQGFGLTIDGISMVLTTFSMSLLFISVIYYTKSIWSAATLHVTGNILLHTFGFDGANKGLLQIIFLTSKMNGLVFLVIFELLVIAFAVIIFSQTNRNLAVRSNESIYRDW